MEAVQDILGYLLLAKDAGAMQINQESVTYDILLQRESMEWTLILSRDQHSFVVNLQAGSLRIEMSEDDKLVRTETVTYSQAKGSSNSHLIRAPESIDSIHLIKIKMTALTNSDYSLEIEGSERQYQRVQVGRPYSITISDQLGCL